MTVRLQRLWIKPHETALAPQPGRAAPFAVPVQTGTAAGTVHAVLLTSVVERGRVTESLQHLLFWGAFFGAACLGARLQLQIQLKGNGTLWHLLLCTPCLCLVSLRVPAAGDP